MSHKFCAVANKMATGILCFSFLVLAGACSTSKASRESTWEAPPGASRITVNGYPITYEEKGSGPTVILVPGVLTDYRIWKRQMENLSSRHHVVAISLRHFYPEPWNGRGDDFTVHQHASDLAKIIEAMTPPVDIVGWSYGAHVSFETARKRPELIRRLVLAEAPIDSLVSPDSAASNQVQHDRAMTTAKYFNAGDIDGGLRYALDAINGSGTWDRMPPMGQKGIRENAWTVVGIGLQEPERVTCHDFASLKMPVLLLTGENTTPRFKAIVAKEAECLPSARLETIPRAGHAIPIMNPQAFDKAVSNFLGE